MLTDLARRHQSERDWLLAKAKESQSAVPLQYCSMMRQHTLLEEEEAFTTSALAVGLAERPQELDRDRYDCLYIFHWERRNIDYFLKKKKKLITGLEHVRPERSVAE